MKVGMIYQKMMLILLYFIGIDLVDHGKVLKGIPSLPRG